MAYILKERSHLTKEGDSSLDCMVGTNTFNACGIKGSIYNLMAAVEAADNLGLHRVNLSSLPYIHATSGYMVNGMLRGVTFDEAVVSSERAIHHVQDLDEWKEVVYRTIFKALFKVIDHRFLLLQANELVTKVTVADKCFDLTVKREEEESFSFSAIDTIGFPDSISSELVLSGGDTIDVIVRLKKWLLSEIGARISKGSEKFMIEHLIVPSFLLITSSKFGDSAKPNRSKLELELWYKMF